MLVWLKVNLTYLNNSSNSAQTPKEEKRQLHVKRKKKPNTNKEDYLNYA